MNSKTRTIIIVGAGIFGLTAALELRRRGWAVTVFDPGPIPHPAAASTDLSKVVRMDYGADELYTALGEAAIAGWHDWNRRWGEPLYHQDGFLLMAREPMQPGGFEFESFARLQRRGHSLERLDSDQLHQRFPAWAAEKYPDGYFNPRAGWAASGQVVARLAAEARGTGVVVREHLRFQNLLQASTRVRGLVTSDGAEHYADIVLFAAGAWTPCLLPHLGEFMWATGQAVFHFRVPRPTEFQAPRFPVWAADIARSGWYGFPALPDGTLKVANHGPGRRVHPDDAREVLPAEIERCREFLRDTFPALAEAPLIGTRLCLYCDTFDGDFWIAHDPQREGLMVAAGDSGHAFKFAPVLGGLIADVVEQKPNVFASRFVWRSAASGGNESARCR